MAAPGEASTRPRHVAAVSRHCISRGRGAARMGGAGRRVTAPATNGRWRPAEGRGGAGAAARPEERSEGRRRSRRYGPRSLRGSGCWVWLLWPGWDPRAQGRGARRRQGGRVAVRWSRPMRAREGMPGGRRRCRTPLCPHPSSRAVGRGCRRCWGRCCAWFSPPSRKHRGWTR